MVTCPFAAGVQVVLRIRNSGYNVATNVLLYKPDSTDNSNRMVSCSVGAGPILVLLLARCTQHRAAGATGGWRSSTQSPINLLAQFVTLHFSDSYVVDVNPTSLRFNLVCARFQPGY
jgi:hypothetical protein